MPYGDILGSVQKKVTLNSTKLLFATSNTWARAGLVRRKDVLDVFFDAGPNLGDFNGGSLEKVWFHSDRKSVV